MRLSSYDKFVNKSLLKKILIESVFVLIQLVLSKINLFGFLSPAGMPFAIMRLFSGANIFVVTASYMVSKAYTFVTLSGLLTTVYEIVFLALYFFAKEFIKFKKPWLLNLLFVVLSNVLFLYYSLSDLTSLWHFGVSLALQILLLFFFAKFFKVLKSKTIFFKFSHSDFLVFSLMALMLSIGLFSFVYLEKYFGLFLALCPVVLLCKILPTEKYFTVILTLAIGALIATTNIIYLILITISALVLLEIKAISKYIYSVICLCLFAIFALIFNLFDVFSLISMFFAVFVYVVIPKVYIEKVSSLFEIDSLSIVTKTADQQRVNEIKNRLMLMSSTFSGMQNDFKFLVVGKINRESASTELACDVIKKCCSECENFKNCFYENINKKAIFERLMLKAIEGEQVEQSDLSNGIQAYCFKTGIVVSEINQTAKMFHSYEAAVKTEDVSKLIISNELGNFADIFANFSKNLSAVQMVNSRLSKILKDRLMNGLVDSKEVVIFENENGIENISVILPNEQVMKREVVEIISKVTRVRVKVEKVKHLEFSGLSLVSFSVIPKLSASFAVSSKSKEDKNGDSTIITKLSGNKFFVAIADGMGHGGGANKISSMVLSLIRSMFQVGLDEKLILESVNKLLLPAGLDNFTTLDACVIDLENLSASFIKLGSSVSVLKHKNTSEIVSCESLPIGIVQNIKPTIIKKQISAGDMIFLASDGVVDSFSNIETYKCFVNDAKIYNMQKFLDNVVGDAEVQGARHPDDMTIIGINLLKN